WEADLTSSDQCDGVFAARASRKSAIAPIDWQRWSRRCNSISDSTSLARCSSRSWPTRCWTLSVTEASLRNSLLVRSRVPAIGTVSAALSWRISACIRTPLDPHANSEQLDVARTRRRQHLSRGRVNKSPIEGHHKLPSSSGNRPELDAAALLSA